jgi:hypothetical protein
MKNKKGISLIVLVVTIIVIIILAATVMLSLSQNDPIMSAEEATFKSDIDLLQNELNMQIMSQLTQTLGTFDSDTMTGEVSEYIPSVTKYDDTFDIVKGKLVYTGNDAQILSYVRSMNLDLITVYDGTIPIVKPTINVINTSEGTVETWVNVTNSMREEVADKYIFSTYADEKYTNTLALRHTRDNTWQAIMSSDYNNVSDISVADTLNEGWHLFSLKWSSTEFSLFIDGIKAVTTVIPKIMQAVSTDLHIGNGPKLNLVRNGYVTAGNNTNFPGLTYIISDYTSANASFTITGPKNILSTDYILVDPNKSYTQNGSFKSIGVGGNSLTYYGISTYDKDKNFIMDHMVNHFVNTETKLVQDLKPGDTIVYVESANNWRRQIDSSSCRYIGIYPYKEYPLYTYTGNCYTFSDSNATTNTITLTLAYNGDLIPAGTKVANNFSAWGTYTYNTIGGSYISNVWTLYTSKITGNVANMTNMRQFRYGTKYIKIMLLLDYGQSSSFATIIDDLEFIDTADVIFNSKIQEVCISNIARSDSDILDRFKSGILSKDGNVTYMLTEQ